MKIEHKKGKPKKNVTYIQLLQILTVIALLFYMQVMVSTGKISKVFLAAPTDIVKKGLKIITDGTLASHLIVTLQEVFAGYLAAAVVGIVVGLLWVLFPKLEAYMSMFCSAIMAVPKTAILPLLILWFGIGFQSKVVLIFLFCVFTVLFNMVTGAKQSPKEYLKVARVFEASRMQTVFGIMIPASLPSMFNGLRLSSATALAGVVFSEMQSAKAGLGFLLSEAQNNLDTAKMFFIIILVTLISIVFVKLIEAIEYAFCHKWRRV